MKKQTNLFFYEVNESVYLTLDLNDTQMTFVHFFETKIANSLDDFIKKLMKTMNTFLIFEEDERVDMPQWKELLIEVEKIESKYDSSLRNPVSNSEIIKMKQTFQKKLGNIIIPESYIEFLKNVNGLDFNGLVIYGVDETLLDNEVEEEVQGFIETNEIWYENDWQKQYIFFGDSDTAWYCYDLNEGVYVELDKPSGTLIKSFDSFDSMVSDALEASLL
jgi:hypothetical protein